MSLEGSQQKFITKNDSIKKHRTDIDLSKKYQGLNNSMHNHKWNEILYLKKMFTNKKEQVFVIYVETKKNHFWTSRKRLFQLKKWASKSRHKNKFKFVFFITANIYWKFTSFESKFTSYELKSTNYEFKSTSNEFKSVSYEIKYTSYEFKSTSYKFKSTSCKFKLTSYGFKFTSHDLRNDVVSFASQRNFKQAFA